MTPEKQGKGKRGTGARKRSATSKTVTASAGVPTDGSDAEGPPAERLHKFLASTGAGSRRECEVLIEQGRVTVNGKLVTKMGVKVVPGEDAVTLDGEKVKPEDKVYYLLNKPSGYICTNADERNRPRARDLVPDDNHRIYTVGRLDAESKGMILLTNDGTIANIICHPRYRIEKAYQVAVRGMVDRQQITRLEAGVWLAEGKSSPAKVRRLGHNEHRGETLLEMTLFEGRNREIRRVFNRVGLKVRRLVRTRIGPLHLGELAEGAWCVITRDNLRFVGEARRLYLANQELWDAELPQEERRRKPARSPRAGGARRSTGGQGGGQGGRDAGPTRPQGRPRREGRRTAAPAPESPPRRRRRFY